MAMGYARSASDDENCKRQIEELVRSGVSNDCLYADKSRTDSVNQPELKKILKRIKKGNTLVVCQISCLGGSLQEVVTAANYILEQGGHIRSLLDGIDTSAEKINCSYTVFRSLVTALQSFQRESHLRGIMTAKRKGRPIGRPRRLSEKKVSAIRSMLQEGESISYIAKKFEVSSRTISRIKNSTT